MANFFKDYHATIKSKREQEQKQAEQIKKTETTAQDVENAVIDFLENQPETEEGEIPFPEIDYVRPFEGYLCSNNNGVVIDLKNGIQVLLTIQIRQ